LIGADEFINNKKRYCLWLVDCPPDELRKMPLVMERVNRVREDRLKSTDKGMQNLAPTRFRETNNPVKCLVIPVVSSEKRKYIPNSFFLVGDFLYFCIPFQIMDGLLHFCGIRMISGIEGKYFLSGYPDVIGNRIHIHRSGRQYKSARMVVGYNICRGSSAG
jgi:hypothetical protein